MRQVEKLRELLADAGMFVSGCAFDGQWSDPPCACLDCRESKVVRQRIDAALAEPVQECSMCEVSKAFHDVAVKQRDAAWWELNQSRAEVERLRKLLGRTDPIACKSCGKIRERSEGPICGACGLPHDGSEKDEP